MAEENGLVNQGRSDDPSVEPYVPFPSFERFMSTEYSPTVFDSFSRQLENLRESASPEVLAAAVNVATRWAAVNTGAIEGLYEVDRGFTYSVAISSAAWESIHAVKGDAAANHMQDALNAYDFVLDAVTDRKPITEVWIRSLHEIVTNSQSTYSVITAVGPQDHALPRGVYKTHPNSPLNIASHTVHSYASPADTPAEMARLMSELRSEEFERAHPVLQAAYSHYAFVCIHPFADGNGRVSRALASVFLYRAPGVPLVIFADQKGAYIDCLEAADKGDYSRFVRFISERAIDTVGMVKAEVSSGLVPDVPTQVEAFAGILTGREGLSHTEIDNIATRLLDVVAAAFSKQVSDNPVPAPLQMGSGRLVISQSRLPDGFRSIPGSVAAVSLGVQSAPPASANVQRTYNVGVARPGTEVADFVVFSRSRVLLEVYIREMHPTVSSALVFRAEAEALREVREAVSEAAEQAAASLRKAGYVS